jgi:hypothetical protein
MADKEKKVVETEINKATGKPMPKFVTRKSKRRYFVSDENGILKEAQVAGDAPTAGTVGVWGATAPSGFGTAQSSDVSGVGTVEEFPDENGEAQGLIFLNVHTEATYEYLMESATAAPEIGDVIDTDKYVTRPSVKTQAKGWKTLSIQCRTI